MQRLAKTLVQTGLGILACAATLALASSASAELLPNGTLQLAGGTLHTCAVTTAGSVQCWGYDGDGQLGDGTTVQHNIPVNVSGLTGATAVATGGTFSCALLNTGGVKCWGQNLLGQLGDGTNTGRTTPVDVIGLSGTIIAITAGANHMCALNSAGGVQCWGYNGTGALGDGTTSGAGGPMFVSGLTGGVVAISAGQDDSCALTSAGGIKCWGSNGNGQLGDGTTTNRLTPVDVSGLSGGVVALATGWRHTCALTTAGGVKCWGKNFQGQIGDGTNIDRSTPTEVSGLASGISAIAANGNHTCAATSAGAVKCWGYNFYGELGDGTTNDRNSPADVIELPGGVIAIAGGGNHTCARTNTNAVQCWGRNSEGQIGDGTYVQRLQPTNLLLAGITATAGGRLHTCALTSGGALKCWGDNAFGQLGDGTTSSHSSPVSVSGLDSGILAVTGGENHTCALTATRGVKCWGDNSFGQLGDGTTTERHTPVDVNGLGGIAAISAGWNHTCALTTGGTVLCWGDNQFGQLGDGTTTNRTTPVSVSGLSGILAIAGGGSFTCAVVYASPIQCWGYNGDGQLGDGTQISHSTPANVAGFSYTTGEVAAGANHACALTLGGGVYCWGQNTFGQLGDSTTTRRLTPVQVTGLASGISQVAAGASHTCAVTDTGGVQCWGQNADGELGDGTTTNRSFAGAVSGLSSGISSVALGGWHNCAVTRAAGVKCWGLNDSGQVGNGTLNNSTTPVRIYKDQQWLVSFDLLTSRILQSPPFTLHASSSSGLGVSFASTTPTICTVSGSVVTLQATGACTITASQGGNADIAAAPVVSRSFGIFNFQLSLPLVVK